MQAGSTDWHNGSSRVEALVTIQTSGTGTLGPCGPLKPVPPMASAGQAFFPHGAFPDVEERERGPVHGAEPCTLPGIQARSRLGPHGKGPQKCPFGPKRKIQRDHVDI